MLYPVQVSSYLSITHGKHVGPEHDAGDAGQGAEKGDIIVPLHELGDMELTRAADKKIDIGGNPEFKIDAQSKAELRLIDIRQHIEEFFI